MGNTCSQGTSPIGKPRMLSIVDDHNNNDTKIMMIMLLLMKILLLMMIMMMMYFRYPESKPCSWTAQA
jgi:hypothetical protein